MPAEATASALAGALAEYESIENLKILLLRAEVAGKELPAKLEELGAIVDDVACYKTVPETEDRNGAAARLWKDGADWITFASASAVENFHARINLKPIVDAHPRLQFASIGPETSKALLALGFSPPWKPRSTPSPDWSKPWKKPRAIDRFGMFVAHQKSPHANNLR